MLHLDHVASEVAVVGEGNDCRAEHELILEVSCITFVHVIGQNKLHCKGSWEVKGITWVILVA